VIFKLLHKTLAVGLALLVLISTVSFTINSHYCGDTLVDTAIFKEAQACGMELQSNSASSECSIMKKNCCSNEKLLIEGQDELKISFDKLSIDQQFFIASFVSSYINLFEGLEENVTSFQEYEPPPVIRQIYKIDETYLI